MASFSNFWCLAFLIPMYLLKESSSSYYNWVRYGLITALTSVPYCESFLPNFCSLRNHLTHSDRFVPLLPLLAMSLSQVIRS